MKSFGEVLYFGFKWLGWWVSTQLLTGSVAGCIILIINYSLRWGVIGAWDAWKVYGWTITFGAIALSGPILLATTMVLINFRDYSKEYATKISDRHRSLLEAESRERAHRLESLKLQQPVYIQPPPESWNVKEEQ